MEIVAGNCIYSDHPLISLGKAWPVVPQAYKSQICIVISYLVFPAAPWETSPSHFFSEEGFEASEVNSLIQTCLFDKRWCCLASDPSFLASGSKLVTTSLAYPLLLFFQGWCGARGPSIRRSWQLCPFGWGGSSQMGLAGCLALSRCLWLLAWMDAFVSPGKSQESLGQMEGSASHRLLYNVLLRLAWVLQQSCMLVFSENFS